MSNFYKNPNRIKSNYQIHVEGKSKDEQARQRVTFLMKTTIKELIKSKKYKQFVKDAEGGKWRPGGEYYKEYMAGSMPGQEFVEQMSPFLSLQPGGGLLKTAIKRSDKGRREGFEDWLKDYYTTKGYSGDIYKGKGLMDIIFPNRGKKKQEEQQAPQNIWDFIKNANTIPTTDAKQDKKSSNAPFNLANIGPNDPT